jgi:hypothetical protein
VESDASPPEDRAGVYRRRDRQRAEILRAIDDQLLHRAADLAHEHLVEFADDQVVRSLVFDVLSGSPDHRLRRRAGEFVTTESPD